MYLLVQLIVILLIVQAFQLDQAILQIKQEKREKNYQSMHHAVLLKETLEVLITLN